MINENKLSYDAQDDLEQGLDETILKDAYIQANKDVDRLKTIKEWEVLDGENWND